MKNLITIVCFLLISKSSYSQNDPKNFEVLPPQLVLHLPFNGNALDASGYNNHPSIVNASLTQDRFGFQNSAYKFNGVNNYIEIPNSSSLSYFQGITLSTWVYIDQWYGNTFAPLIAKSTNSGYGMFGMMLLKNSEELEVRLNGTLANHNYTFFANQWYFVTFTWDGFVCRYYVNGLQRGQRNFVGNFDWNNMPLRIGMDTPEITEYLNGKLDDVRIYNDAVSASFIDSLYHLNPTLIDPISVEVPKSFSLFQNYPNPFNPSTYIRFDIQKQGFVKLKVFDLLGKEIKTLVNESLQPGTYETNFDATDLTTGIYIYRLETEGFSDTKRMVLIK
ncbi:MAG TPA: hypothetical protein DEP28_04965 [Bacteroidetes bacterium]|uniref:LamG domain-containing protein n=1 Tax=uncultured Flavobacterium sp. TaxID=165435 RepID=UPI000ED16602|nr:LamG-like jellyroll fold domain-containing protein [uncultured Flavobacterium sp.]HCA42588.1 hypothetical protein [Bacteroidota bacterium]